MSWFSMTCDQYTGPFYCRTVFGVCWYGRVVQEVSSTVDVPGKVLAHLSVNIFIILDYCRSTKNKQQC